MTEPKLVDYCVIPEGLGDWQSLYGDETGTYLYYGAAIDRTKWKLYKIRISDMTIVGSYTGDGNGWDFMSVIVIGAYAYVSIGAMDYNQKPKLFKIDTSSMELVDSLLLWDGVSAHYPELFSDPHDANILWVGSMDDNYKPIIHKIDLSTFTEVDHHLYDIAGCDGGSPFLAIDKNYLYVDVKYGGRFKVSKSNLADWSNFVDATDDQFPRRYPFLVNGHEYVLYEAKWLSKINAQDRTQEYYYDLYDTWSEGLVHFLSEPEYFYVVDMDLGDGKGGIIKLKDTGTGFEEVYRWEVPYEHQTAIFACWFYETDDGERYIFMADWCGSYPDTIYKVRVSPPFLSSMYHVKVKLMELISEASDELQPREKHVLGNWRLNYWDLDSDNFPLVTVRITRGRQWEPIYGARAAPYPKHIVFHFTIFIFALNSSPKAKNAQNIADQILDFFTNYNKFEVNSRTKIIDVVGLRYFELEPERGSHRLSRIILEGDLICVFDEF